MKTRSTTRANGASPGRDHVLPPPTRKPRGPAKTKLSKPKDSEQGPAKAGCENSSFYHILNLIIPSANKAILLEWLGLLFIIVFLHVMTTQTPLTHRTAGKRSAVDDANDRPARRRRIQPVSVSPM